MTYRLGIDIGGTFTDGALVDEESGAMRIVKVLTTPKNPADGFMLALGRVLDDAKASASAVSLLVHATTIATNALIEGNIARIGLLATEGFRDVLEIAYQIRPTLYDIFQAKPRPLVERRWCFGIPGRLDAEGKELAPLDLRAVRAAVADMKAGGVEAVVIAFLHSYINPAHERQAEAIVRELFPAAHLSVSSRVCPEFREFPRTSTAAVNAAAMPVVSRYVDELARRLAAAGTRAPLYLMQSNGGVMSAETARTRPVYMIESGPAAGVIAAAAVAESLGYRNVISFDMGGTTAKVGLVQDSRPRLSNEYEVGNKAHSPLGEGKGGGYPVRTPVIDLVEVGAGGGSLAWIDSGGSLRVGPRSAGAVPGPACYGRGGRQPAITDANLVLGRLDPDFFVGGELKLDAAAARAALASEVARPLGLDVQKAAHGVVEIADAGMIAAMRLVSVQRGYDPRDFALVAFGGAGPLHAGALAQQLGMRTIVIPTAPGVVSAAGVLDTDIKHELVATRRVLLEEAALDAIDATFAEFEDEAAELLKADREQWHRTSFVRTADLRYRGQSHELRVVLPDGRFDERAVARTRRLFEEMHERAYGYAANDDPVELTNIRLTSIGHLPKLASRTLAAGDGDIARARKSTRALWLPGAVDPVAVPVYDRYRLSAEARVAGPALIEEMDSTTVVLPAYRAVVHSQGHLILTAD
jgi:N-methylhydantoinase A